MELSDQDVLNAARQRVTYCESYKNSLVEWTLSSEWTKPSYNQKWRGEVCISEYTPGYSNSVSYCSEVSGEFNAR